MNIAYNMDCMEYMRTLPDKAFDLAVVDPPYGSGDSQFVHVEREREREKDGPAPEKYWQRFGGDFDKYRQRSADGGRLGDEVRNKIIAWDTAPGPDYFRELARVSRNQIIWGGNYFCLAGTRCFLIWRKTNIPLEGFSMAPCEYAWTSFFQNARIFEFSSTESAQGPRLHPTQKPVQLYAWIYQHFARPGDKILDTHLGSGSSRIAAWDAGLDFVGCEIDADYFAAQEARYQAHVAQMSLFVEGNT